MIAGRYRYSTHQLLSSCHKKLWERIKGQLSTLVTVGGEFNVGIYADSHTFNIASLGLAEDTNIRANLGIICQARIDRQEDAQGNSFTLMGNLIQNRWLIPNPEERERLGEQLAELMPVSETVGVPVILSVAGQPQLALLPDLREYKGKKTVVPAPNARQRLERVWEMEYSEAEPSEEPALKSTNQPQGEDSSPLEKRFTQLELTREQAIAIINELRSAGLNQTQVIERLWACKKGGSDAWKKAHAQFKELTEGGSSL